MDGSQLVVQVLDSANMPTRSFMFATAGTTVVAPSLPSLDAGFRHPCRNDGSQHRFLLVPKHQLGNAVLEAPASAIKSS